MWESTIDIYLWFWSLQEKHCLRFLITPPTSPETAVGGVIGVADASRQHHFQHRSVSSEIVSHTCSHAHEVCSNIREELVTEDVSLMPTCQIGNTLKSGCVCCCCWLFQIPQQILIVRGTLMRLLMFVNMRIILKSFSRVFPLMYSFVVLK